MENKDLGASSVSSPGVRAFGSISTEQAPVTLLLVTIGMLHGALRLARHFRVWGCICIYIFIPFTDNVLITNILIYFRTSM